LNTGFPAIALCFKNETQRGLTIFYVIETQGSGGWRELSNYDDGARILWYVPAGASQVLAVRPPPEQPEIDWRISFEYTVGYQNPLERVGNWLANRLGFGPLKTPFRTISSPVFEKIEQPNKVAPGEPTLPVSRSGIPGHRTRDSLPTPAPRGGW